MKKRNLFAGAMSGVLASAMILGSSIPVLAAPDDNEVYYNLTPVANISELTEGDTLLISTSALSTQNAYAELPDDLTLIKYDGKFDNNDPTKQAYFGEQMYNVDGSPMAEGCYTILQGGYEFGSCEIGTFAYTTPDKIQAAIGAGKVRNMYDPDVIFYERGFAELDSKFKYNQTPPRIDDFDEFLEHEAELNNYPFSSSTKDDFIIYYGNKTLTNIYNIQKPDMSFTDYLATNFGLVTSPIDKEGWFFGCQCGANYFMGPYYIYKFDIATFTAEDVSAQLKKGIKFPTSETEITTDDINVMVNIDGQKYNVPLFYIDYDNNTIGPNDNTITVILGNTSVEIVVFEAPEEPVKPDNNNKDKGSVPTGDASNLALFAGIGIISAAALSLVVYKKKSNA